MVGSSKETKRGCIFERLTDPNLYTGSQKYKFEQRKIVERKREKVFGVDVGLEVAISRE